MMLNCSVFSSHSGEVGTVFADVTSGDFDDGESNVNALHWAYSNHTLTISKNSGNGVMPDFDEENRPAWESTYKNDIETAIFENGITTIGAYLFSDYNWDTFGELYPNLKVVTINGTITSIGDSAFAFCENLERFNSNRQYEIVIPDSVEDIGSGAFDFATKIKYLTVGENAKSVDGYCFYSFYYLEQINFNAINFIENCEDHEFSGAGASSFQCKLVIGPNVEYIDGGLFSNNEHSGYYINAVEVDSNNEKYYSQNNAIIERNTVDDTGDKLIFGCRNTIIPNNIKTIGDGAFDSCYGLCSITIPSSVQNIEAEAFRNCLNLIEIYNYSNISMAAGVGTDDNGNIAVHALYVYNLNENDDVPQSKIIEIDNVIYYKKSETEYTAFAINNKLVNIILLSEKTKEIYYDFCSHNCNILSIILPNSINIIRSQAFYNCYNIKEIWIASNANIGDNEAVFGNTDGYRWYKYTNSTTPVGSAITSVEDLVGDNGEYVHYIREDVTPYAVTLTCSDVVLEDKPFWTLSNSNHTATKIVANGCPYGELPQGANGEPISWRDSSQKRVMVKTIVDLEDDIALTGTYSTFPNTGVGVDVILPSGIILTLSVAIVFVAFGGKKRKVIVK